MGEIVKLSAFILLGIGTLGLLINELVFDWGKIATLIFASINITGLVVLGFTYFDRKE